MRFDEAGYRYMYDKYVPRLTDAGKPSNAKSATPDPNVVYVGPFFDGLVMMGVFKNVPAVVPHTIKPFFYEAAMNPEKGFGMLYERCNNIDAVMERDEPWPYVGATYDRPLDLSTLWRDQQRYEPGQFSSTPQDTTERGGPPDFWERAPEKTFHDIVLQEDNRFQLHIMRRGDRVTKTWRPDIGSDTVTQIFVLRNWEDGSTTRLSVPEEEGFQRV
jgi:hypothetical protein